MTLATCGPNGTGSSLSAVLQSCLASRLPALMGSSGSTLFSLTWKEAITPSGRRICLLRASGRLTSASASSSWPSPNASGADRGGQASRAGGRRSNLIDSAQLAPWPTATANDAKGSAYSYRNGDHERVCLKLPGAARLSGWPTVRAADGAKGGKRRVKNGQDLPTVSGWATPAARDWRDGRASPETMARNARPLNEQAVAALGTVLSGSSASMAKRGQLNPAFCLWLMGFPAEWENFAPSATQLSPRRRRRSSAP